MNPEDFRLCFAYKGCPPSLLNVYLSTKTKEFQKEEEEEEAEIERQQKMKRDA